MAVAAVEAVGLSVLLVFHKPVATVAQVKTFQYGSVKPRLRPTVVVAVAVAVDLLLLARAQAVLVAVVQERTAHQQPQAQRTRAVAVAVDVATVLARNLLPLVVQASFTYGSRHNERQHT